MRPIRWFLAATIVMAAACSAAPTAPTSWSAERVVSELVATNVDAAGFGGRGVTTRWTSPIAVNTGGIARAEEAVRFVEAASGGLIRFQRVTGTPADGILFVEGGGLNEDSSPGCGHVTDAVPPANSNTYRLRWDASGAIAGTIVIHLGSERCDDEAEGHHPSAVAEHELGHALGLGPHFEGFVGNEGLTHPGAFAVLCTLYANPVGTSRGAIRAWGAR